MHHSQYRLIAWNNSALVTEALDQVIKSSYGTDGATNTCIDRWKTDGLQCSVHLTGPSTRSECRPVACQNMEQYSAFGQPHLTTYPLQSYRHIKITLCLKKQTPNTFSNNPNKCSQIQIMVGKKSRQITFYICHLKSLQLTGNSNNSDLFYH